MTGMQWLGVAILAAWVLGFFVFLGNDLGYAVVLRVVFTGLMTAAIFALGVALAAGALG